MTPAARTVDVTAVDPHDADAFDEWFAVWHETDMERWPEGPGWQYEELRAMALDRESDFERRPIVARDAGTGIGAVVGVVGLEMTRRENHHLARLDVRVRPGHRRRGVGTALVEASARIATTAGRTELAMMAETPVRPDYVDAAEPFARHLGFTVVQRMVRRRLDLPVDTTHADGLRLDPRAAPPGYTLLTFADRWPDEYLDDRCALGHRMSTDVPVGEQVLDEQIWDAARVRALEASLAAQNRAKVTTVARHDASGTLVAFTEVVIPLGAPESTWQHDTLVMREHRGHGLGFAVKLANLFALHERHPAVRCINTWNADDNAPMIAVNVDLGFHVVAHSADWHRPVAPPGPAPAA